MITTYPAEGSREGKHRPPTNLDKLISSCFTNIINENIMLLLMKILMITPLLAWRGEEEMLWGDGVQGGNLGQTQLAGSPN